MAALLLVTARYYVCGIFSNGANLNSHAVFACANGCAVLLLLLFTIDMYI